jgi:hypothetical protein
MSPRLCKLWPLLYVQGNDLGRHGPKFGCGLGQCGVCTVIIDKQAVRSCLMPIKAVGRDVARGHATLATKRTLLLTWALGPDFHRLDRTSFAWRTHSITSSARADRVGGTSMPSAFAVRRLITNSNLVDCTTGKSAGSTPLRIRPV